MKGPTGDMATGCLYVVATPIGNLDDISARAIRTLQSVSLIAAEDTRHSRRLLDHFGIATPLTSYHEHNERDKTEHLIAALLEGRDVALITDAGTPCISDPGYRVVDAAQRQNIRVVAIPGPSAVIAALSISGLPPGQFSFHGFFPRKASEVAALMARMQAAGGTHICYESPNRLCDTLRAIEAQLHDPAVCVARELTKIHEETIRGAASEVRAYYEQNPPRGECVILINIPERNPGDIPDSDIVAAVRAATEAGMSRRDAVRKVTQDLGVPRNRVYDLAGES